MLQQLIVRNYAIIDDLTMSFGSGLHIITGETGAGKSILVGALGLVLGDRADTTVLFNPDEKCFVEATFQVGNNQRIQALLKELDIDTSTELIMRRDISAQGKSRSFINDTPVNLQSLRRLAAMLVDLHRQFDTLDVSDQHFQREVVDAIAGQQALAQSYQQQYAAYMQAQRQLQHLQQAQQAARKEQDYLQFLHQELAELNLQPQELEQLEQEQQALVHAEDIKAALGQVVHQLQYDEQPVVQALRQMVLQLQGLKASPAGLDTLLERMQGVQVELKDIAYELEALQNGLDMDAARLAFVAERLNAGNRLLKKHGFQTSDELLALQAELAAKLQAVADADESLAGANTAMEKARDIATATARKLQAGRQKAIPGFEAQVKDLLAKVGMPNARLKVQLDPRAEPGIHGLDELQLLFDANKSGRMEPVDKVASGGELSRLMLVIKSLVAKGIHLPTLIFDEIDTGISGEAARQVGLIMEQLAQNHQLVAITHQPQIAARAHHHYFVYKTEKQGKIRTAIRALEAEERIEAIARMLGGDELTEASLKIARQLAG